MPERISPARVFTPAVIARRLKTAIYRVQKQPASIRAGSICANISSCAQSSFLVGRFTPVARSPLADLAGAKYSPLSLCHNNSEKQMAGAASAL